jgi:transposase
MKLHVFCFDLPQSDACFIKAYPVETTEAFLDGHVSAFAFFGGVPISILYDNLKIAVARILGDGKRRCTRAFTELVSHYLFQERFGRPGKGNDKGKVEALVKYSRANFLTPVPHVGFRPLFTEPAAYPIYISPGPELQARSFRAGGRRKPVKVVGVLSLA